LKYSITTDFICSVVIVCVEMAICLLPLSWSW
jgi:hypothetical protein